METITYTSARNNLAKTMERVCDTHSPVIITHEPDNSVIMISLEDFQALEETVYLLRSPANACRLLESITELNTGKGLEKRLVE
ncbi:MAG: type II toxin-antitoxin system prevent-host-death family antitoxin [Deltaproteobacteria bacterium]|nr:MAG: type II toxin-antitoxin system prevent-host-death family antitoxin [Deltaproteobacteria bacterium]